MLTPRLCAVAAALLLSVSAGQAMAADVAAKFDPKDCEKPDFPARWMNEGDAGNVVVAFLVGADGKVVESKILESSGSSRVDRASAKAGARCKFQAGSRDGQAAPGWAKVRYTWLVD
ncbi:MAG: energy transducer TonB [Massilia sp.]